jgi:hypothetical protein
MDKTLWILLVSCFGLMGAFAYYDAIDRAEVEEICKDPAQAALCNMRVAERRNRAIMSGAGRVARSIAGSQR